MKSTRDRPYSRSIASRGAVIVLSLSFLCLARGASAEEETRKSVLSASRRFILTGSDPALLVSLGRWAEDLTVRVERATQVKLKWNPNVEFRIIVDSSAQAGRTGVSRRQEAAGGRLVQRLLLGDPDRTDWEQAAEDFCALLLNIYAMTGRKGQERARQLVEVSDWLPVGVIQNIDSSLRARNRKAVLHWKEDGGFPSFADLLKWHELPAGRCREKAVCGAAVAWMLDLPGGAARLEKVLARVAEGEHLTAQWMAGNAMRCASSDQLENDWKKWIGRLCLEGVEAGTMPSEAVDALREQIIVRAGESLVPADAEIAGDLEFHALIGLKKAKWMKEFCKEKAETLRSLAVGRPPEFAEVVESYCEFIDGLRRGRRDSNLTQILSRADSFLKRLAGTAAAREKYMDAMEREYGMEREQRPRGDEPALEQSRLDRYIDGVERRMSRPSPTE